MSELLLKGEQITRRWGGLVAVDPLNPLHTLRPEPLPESLSPVTTLMDNGPSANRIDLVFVGDGYQAGELGLYASDVDGILPVFFAKEPLDHYISFFNVHRVDVTSIRAHTKPGNGASARVLRKNGFQQVGEVEDPEDGLVWRWERSIA